jgi:hypothetical protein
LVEPLLRLLKGRHAEVERGMLPSLRFWSPDGQHFALMNENDSSRQTPQIEACVRQVEYQVEDVGYNLKPWERQMDLDYRLERYGLPTGSSSPAD